LLRAHRWPGNVRELRAAISNAALIAEDKTIGVGELGGVERAALADVAELPTSLDSLRTIEELNLAYVTRVVDLCGGNKALAAQKLGISRQTLARWLAEPGAA
jgi:DNA-binding NtrC family response regulator